MVVCKFFQQGYCRFGQSCKFEHVYGTKYNYHANTSSQPTQNQSAGVTDEQLVRQVQLDIQAALKGGQWLLSSYAPFKEKPVFPGINDLSPEEARLFIYEAKANNNLDQAIAYMNSMIRDTHQKYEQLLQPTLAIIKVLKSIYKGEVVTSPFEGIGQNSFGNSSNSASSIFRNAAQNVSVFGQNNASPNQSALGTAPNNVFGQQNPDFAAKSIFAQATQNTFGQNTNQGNNFFATSPENTAAKSIFAQASQNIFGTTSPNSNNPGSVFATANQNLATSPFNQNFSTSPSVPRSDPFGQQEPLSTQTPFEQKSSGFGANVFQQTSDEVGVYSKIDDLAQEDIEAFQSQEFKLGFIPEVPPPKTLCF